ncbi:hypothetical protein DOS57_09785 [Staphylococcus felis]|nr:hypothetical protein DOS57_09785 [Staphylococcus felis]REI18038.1 hypothetical protein DOS73_00540 [Staphylococcus felis]
MNEVKWKYIELKTASLSTKEIKERCGIRCLKKVQGITKELVLEIVVELVESLRSQYSLEILLSALEYRKQAA